MRGVTFLAIACALACRSDRAGSDKAAADKRAADKAAGTAAPQPTLAEAGAAGLAAVQADRLRAHVLFLADDELEGRGTGTRGHLAAADYVQKELAAIGLEPAGEGGTWFQEVPLRALDRVEAECRLEVGGKSVPAGEVIFRPFAGSDRVALEGPLVYVGYGITAPDQSYDDVGPADLGGAIAIVLRGAPPSFKPATSRALHSDFDLKAARLAAAGAVAIIAVQTPEGEKMRPWAQRRLDSRFESMEWMDGEKPGSGAAIPIAAVSMAGFQALLGPLDGAELWTEAESGKARPRALGRRARLRVRSTFRDLTSPNVVGVLRGGDPRLAGEHVVFTAHLDHLGIGEPVDGDRIYNGALDDASGVAALIEVARAFAALPERPPRSILFLAVTAEEKGLLGSDYFAHRPTVPIASIVADVNLDPPNPLYEMFDVVPLGAAHSSLARNVAEAAGAMKIAVSDDPAPEQGFFIRSDQYSFVKQGVPSLFPIAGRRDASGGTEKNTAIFDAWLARHYHKPSDEWREGEYAADRIAKETRLDFLIGLSIARDPARPTWNSGDIFPATFRR